jgi:hypothetical protein
MWVRYTTGIPHVKRILRNNPSEYLWTRLLFQKSLNTVEETQVANETAVMGRKKKPQSPDTPADGSEQYRKPYKAVRIRIRLATIAEQAAAHLEQDLTQFVNDALRERLERLTLWPPGGPRPTS